MRGNRNVNIEVYCAGVSSKAYPACGHEIKSLVGGMKLKGIIAFLQSLSLIESELYTEVIKLAKLIIVMPATNAVSERTFSALRRLKTWLRSTMHQSRLNWCMLLHVHKDESDKLDLAIIGNEFASRNSSRQVFFLNECI